MTLNKSQYKVLVLAPDYPSAENLYACAFVHTRVKKYIQAGLLVDMVVFDNSVVGRRTRTYDGIQISTMGYSELKQSLTQTHYAVIVCHFFNEYIFQILYARAQDSQIVLINHGYESQIEEMKNIERPYFTKEQNLDNAWAHSTYFLYYSKFASATNVHWVFVSEWLKNKALETYQVAYRNVYVIPNWIDENIFSFKEKNEEDRKKLLVIKKFSSSQHYAVDQVVLAIRQLSQKDIFKELSIDIYGDGDAFDMLLKPLEKYENVKIKRGFIPNRRIPEVVGNHGILLAPTRYDSQGVTACEVAACGCVPVTTDICAISESFSGVLNGLMARPEQYQDCVKLIEFYYKNPTVFQEKSRQVALQIKQNFCESKTIGIEIHLINSLLEKAIVIVDDDQKVLKTKLLTTVVAAYNVEKYLDKCLRSLLNISNRSQLEILVINDGSKDSTSEIARKYEKLYPEVVRLIDKTNAGHGSVINLGIREAKGKYLRIIDGDDWVDSENFQKFLTKLSNEDSDLIVNPASYDYVDGPAITNIVDYPYLREGVQYRFDDLTYKHYGFEGFNPRLPTSTYRTMCLRDANFSLSENCRYVDMEFNVFSITKISTVAYYPFDVYRYLIGRAGQSVSIEGWKRFLPNHLHVIKRLLNTVAENHDSILTEEKRVYVMSHLVLPMACTQVFMFHTLGLQQELKEFLSFLQSRPIVYQQFVGHVLENDPTVAKLLFGNNDAKIVMNQTSEKIMKARNKEKLQTIVNRLHSIKTSRKLVKMLLPYGIVRLYQIYKGK